MAPGKESSTSVSKYALDGFSNQLSNVLEERLARIRQFVDEDKACTREDLARFIWGTARAVRSTIKPEKDDKRRDAWQAAKGMLKEIVDFDKFRPTQFSSMCVKNVLEKKTAEVIDNYKVYVMTGEIRTRWFPPKLLGETDEILCVDKPCLYTCTYGGNSDDLSPPPRAGAESASALLNGEKGEIQIHEYLALKFNYETAVATREWWKSGATQIPCYCGHCGDKCSITQSGCCNRLDKETSGVMICAKTKKGFPEIRKQFKSEHSIEKGGTEKYYFALCHGEVKVPEEEEVRSPHWKHNFVDGKGRVEVGMKWSKELHKSVAFDSGNGSSGPEKNQWALTLYEPIAWFTDAKGREKYTLTHIRIVTGRTHQIRFHMAEVGHPLVGDPTYGAPWADREWAKRVFLHSYQTKFREPFTLRWFEATSPLPPDLGQVLTTLKLDGVKEPWTGEPFLSRRQHPQLLPFMKQYDPLKPLLFTNDKIATAEAIQAAQGQMAELAGQQAWEKAKGKSWDQNGWNSGKWGAWGQDSWNSGGWNSGGWKSDAKQNTKQAASKGDDDDDDDAWGGWSGGQAAAETKEVKEASAPQEPQEEAVEPPAKRQKQEASSDSVPKAPNTPPQIEGAANNTVKAWKRMESRSQAGVFYYFCEATGETQVEPPAPWEKRESRSQPGVFYYWNPDTNTTSVEKPQV